MNKKEYFKEDIQLIINSLSENKKSSSLINIPLSTIKKIEEFSKPIAIKRLEEYQKRGHSKNLFYIQKDFTRGFICELFMYAWFSKISKKAIKFPDFSLRKDSERIHDPDIEIDKIKIHIKSILKNKKKWAYSANFQKNDLEKKFDLNHWLFLVGISENLSTINLEYFCPMLFLKKYKLFDFPVAKNKFPNKRSIYLKQVHSDLDRKYIYSLYPKASQKYWFEKYLKNLL